MRCRQARSSCYARHQRSAPESLHASTPLREAKLDRHGSTARPRVAAPFRRPLDRRASGKPRPGCGATVDVCHRRALECGRDQDSANGRRNDQIVRHRAGGARSGIRQARRPTDAPRTHLGVLWRGGEGGRARSVSARSAGSRLAMVDEAMTLRAHPVTTPGAVAPTRAARGAAFVLSFVRTACPGERFGHG
jgi:hypothetical protein